MDYCNYDNYLLFIYYHLFDWFNPNSDITDQNTWSNSVIQYYAIRLLWIMHIASPALADCYKVTFGPDAVYLMQPEIFYWQIISKFAEVLKNSKIMIVDNIIIGLPTVYDRLYTLILKKDPYIDSLINSKAS